jgi:hypothetical protein
MCALFRNNKQPLEHEYVSRSTGFGLGHNAHLYRTRLPDIVLTLTQRNRAPIGSLPHGK